MDHDERALYTVHGLKSQSLIMIAPLDTIERIYKLHKSAVQRVLNEANNGCVLYGNGRHEDIVVKYAMQEWQAIGETSDATP